MKKYPGAPLLQPTKTFWMKRSRDFLQKLDWEIGRLEAIPANAFPDYPFQVINVAIACWHMSDWVFYDLSAINRDQLDVKDVKSFQRHIKNYSPELLICREVADASKHRNLDHSPSMQIGTEALDVWADPSGNLSMTWPVTIRDGESREWLDVLTGARDFWVEFMRDHDVP